MSLLLCRQEHVRHPYYIENLGIHIFSTQELAYVIYHYPLMVLDGFVGEGLLAFLREELDQGFLALKLERLMKSGESTDDVLIWLLQESGYCTSAEVSEYRKKIEELRKKHPAELKKIKADELFSMRQYGRAVELYEELLLLNPDEYVNDKLRGRVWNNLGSCYARMFQLEKALDAYEKAYMRLDRTEILGQIYQLSKLDSRLSVSERFSNIMTDEQMEAWDQKMLAAKQRAALSEQVQELEGASLEDRKKLFGKWKQEYRSMV